MNKLLKRALENAAKTGHSLFSPSGAWTHMLCSGSAYMQRDYENESNIHADLGSDKHELSEICLNKGTQADNYEGRIMGFENEVDEQFIEDVQYYTNFVNLIITDSDFYTIEMKVDLSELKGVPGEGGSADAVILKDGGKHLYVIDAKFGYGKVPAEENYQLLEYAIGVLQEMELLGMDDIEKVSLVIVQPQHDLIDEWVTDTKYLRAHAKKVTAAIAEACAAFTTGKPVLTPGPKQCRWCKAFADCGAASDVVFETITGNAITADAFDDLTLEDLQSDVELGTKRADSYNASKLAKCYGMLDFVTDWCKAIGSRVNQKLDAGEAVPGYKLVAGRRGNKRFKSTDDAEATMRTARIKVDDIFTRKLISPTQAEKLLKTDKPKVWAKLGPMIVQPDGKPVVAPESSSKPSLKSTKDQFENLEDDDLC